MGSTKDDSATDGDNSGGDLPDPGSSLFEPNEKVLAYHGPRIYEAKVQKAEIRKKEWRYFVHYLGWNKNWDEWVGMDRLLKHTDENLAKQLALDKKQGVDKNSKSGRSAHKQPKVSSEAKADKEDMKTNVTKGKKRKTDSGIEKDAMSLLKRVKIQIPSSLKKQLLDDWEFVSQQDKLVKLPRSPTISDILDKYLEYRKKKDAVTADSVLEILNGIRSYFDKALPIVLLYKKERPQYSEAVTNDAPPSTVYGAEHLLRLFVKMPDFLAHIHLEDETTARLQQKILDFLKYLQKNQSSFFVSVYDGSKAASEGTSTSSKGKDK